MTLAGVRCHMTQNSAWKPLTLSLPVLRWLGPCILVQALGTAVLASGWATQDPSTTQDSYLVPGTPTAAQSPTALGQVSRWDDSREQEEDGVSEPSKMPAKPPAGCRASTSQGTGRTPWGSFWTSPTRRTAQLSYLSKTWRPYSLSLGLAIGKEETSRPTRVITGVERTGRRLVHRPLRTRQRAALRKSHGPRKTHSLTAR